MLLNAQASQPWDSQVIVTTGGNENSTVGNPNIPCNYYVYNDTSTNKIKAKNCSTGVVDFSSSDSWTVLQSAQNHITHGGILYIGNGTFNLTHQFRLNMTSIEVIGFSNGGSFAKGVTVLRQANGMNMNNSLVFITGGGQSNANNDQLRDLYIQCNNINNPKGTTSEGLYAQGSNNLGLQNISVIGCKYIGVVLQDMLAGYFKNIYSEGHNNTAFYIFSSGNGQTADNIFDTFYADAHDQGNAYYIAGNVHDNQFIGDTSENDNANGFVMQYDGTNFPRSNSIIGLTINEIFGSTGIKGQHGIWILGASYNSFSNCIITYTGQTTTNTYDGIRLEQSGGKNSTNNTFNGCVISSNPITKMKYAIEESNNRQDFNIYTNNQLNGTFGTGLIKTLGIHSMTRNNNPYNPVSASTVTAGASMWNYTNIDGYPEHMVLSTVNGATAITCNTATDSAVLGSTCYLAPSQTMSVTWAGVAPVFTKQPE